MKITFHQFFTRVRTAFAQKPWLWGVVVGVIFLVGLLAYRFGPQWLGLNRQSADFSPPSWSFPADVADLDDLTLLLLGYGGAGHAGGSLSDAIQVVRFHFRSGLITMISIPRDSWVELPGGVQQKINAAYSMDIQNRDPHATTAKQMAEMVTGFPIDFFIGVDFVGFERIIGEELGGIDVEVAETMVDSWYPVRGRELEPCGKTPQQIATLSSQYSGFELEKQFPCRYDRIEYPAGTNHLHGGEALAYVRSRHGVPGGDFARGVRQQEVLTGIKDKLFTLEGATNIPSIFQQFAKHTQTDLDASLAEYLWPALRGSRDYRVVHINLSTDNVLTGGTSAGGASIVQPRESWAAVRQYIQGQLAE